jgi:hypothetical protein
MSFDLQLLTSAATNGRAAVGYMRAGKRFTAIQYTGKAADNLGEVGAKATGEDVNVTPPDVRIGTSDTERKAQMRVNDVIEEAG